MRTLGLAAVVSLALAVPAFAQSSLEGPLAAPDAPHLDASKAKAAKSKSAHHKTKTAHHAAAKSVDSPVPGPTESQPVAQSQSGAPSDPVSLGMKWNATNATAEQTRVQSLQGNAVGTGGALGLNLHF